MTSQPNRPLVLLVEDDRDTREMYAMFLELSGVPVLTAANIDAGFALAIEHQPDIVITDLMLGGPGTGAELCRRVRTDERTRHIPTMVLTGSTRRSDAEAALGAGCNEIRTKPYMPDALLSDVREIFARTRNHPLAG